MDEIQKVLVDAGKPELAQKYWEKISAKEKPLAQTAIEQAISKLNYVPITHLFPDMSKGKKMKNLVRKAVGILEEVLMEIPTPVTYQIVGLDSKSFETDDMAELKKFLKKHKIRQTGTTTRGGRAELKGQPEFEGLLGPMYGGPKKVRYETEEAYNILST